MKLIDQSEKARSSMLTERATWCRCEHGSDAFLTWHRMALWYFERVLQQASDLSTLRLPFWDVGAQPSLPPAFRARTYVDERGRTVPNPLYVAARAPAMNAGTGTVTPFARSAANAMGAASYGVFRTRIENAPHGTVHCAVAGACPTGLMGSIPASANDPIFWLHHANIDRLYECWLRRGFHPTAGLDERNSVIDRDGSMVTRRARDMLTTAQLGYGYTAGSDCPAAVSADLIAKAPANAEMAAKAGMIANEETTANKERTAPREMTVKHEMGADAETARQGAQTRGVGWAERAKVKMPQAGQCGRRAVKIQDVTFDEHPGVMFDVFLQTPEERRQIGVMSFFGDEHHAEPQCFDFDATEAIEALGLAPGEEPEIVFEPTTGFEASAQGETALRAASQADAQLNPKADLRFGRVEIVTE